MIKTKYWVSGIIIVLILSVLVILFQQKIHGEQNVRAEIYSDGELIRTIVLSETAFPYSFTVEGENGKNVVSVEAGRICVSEADCPDQICVHQGWQSGGAAPIVCLPNKLVIQFEAISPEQTEEFTVDGVIQ